MRSLAYNLHTSMRGKRINTNVNANETYSLILEIGSAHCLILARNLNIKAYYTVYNSLMKWIKCIAHETSGLILDWFKSQ